MVIAATAINGRKTRGSRRRRWKEICMLHPSARWGIRLSPSPEVRQDRLPAGRSIRIRRSYPTSAADSLGLP
ncbi:MAG: hypothetical protein CBD91_01650 [Phycisphaeraceae bacterium TMED231]|nr:MAG: hypothetical protein CBD91_01650 [Phycisphaeraceae bacterium TMED231]